MENVKLYLIGFASVTGLVGAGNIILSLICLNKCKNKCFRKKDKKLLKGKPATSESTNVVELSAQVSKKGPKYSELI